MVVALLWPVAATAEPVNWQEAVARLAGERTRAEACVILLKRHGDAAQISHGEFAYSNAKAEIDGVISALNVALASGAQPDSLPDLEARLRRGVQAREAFCAQVVALLRPMRSENGLLADLVGG